MVREAFEILTFQGAFNTNLVIAGTTLLGIAAGVVGVFALLRKRSLLCDAMSHATLPGVCAAFLVATALGLDGRTLPGLLIGAALTGVLAAAAVQAIVSHTRLREDAAIGAVLSVFFGAGVVLLSVVQRSGSGNQGGLNAFIYGQTAAMQVGDAALLGGIAALAILATGLLMKELSLVAFNESFARVDGWRVGWIDALLMGLVALVTVAGLQAVGLILVVAMLIIPAAAARFWTDRLWKMTALAAVIGGASGWLGSAISALVPHKPAGSVIVLTSSALFVVSMLCAPARGVIAETVRRARLRARYAADHLLEAVHEREREGGVFDGSALAALSMRRGWGAVGRAATVRRAMARGEVSRAGDGALTLTERGREEGARIARNHRLWTEYLVTRADIAPSHVDWSVDKVEHVLSEEQVRELERSLAARGGGEA